MIKRGQETFSGYNKPKRTPNHPKKSHAVLAKSGSQTKLIRFGQQGVSGSPKKSRRKQGLRQPQEIIPSKTRIQHLKRCHVSRILGKQSQMVTP